MFKFFQKNPLYGLTITKRSSNIHFPSFLLDRWPGDEESGQKWMDGLVPLPDKLIPFKEILFYLSDARSCPLIYRTYIHSFEWMRDIKVLGGQSARRFICHIIKHWIDHNHSWFFKSWLSPSWQADVIGHRLFNWGMFYNFFEKNASESFRTLFFSSFLQQFCHLQRIYSHTDDFVQRFFAIKGLIFCSILLKKHRKKLNKLLKDCQHALFMQILEDGGHITRSPILQFFIIKSLIDLRSILCSFSINEPPFFQEIIGKMIPILRLLRHGDGRLTCFEGQYESSYCPVFEENIDPVFLDTVLSLSNIKGVTLNTAPRMGYEKLSCNSSLLLINTRCSHKIFPTKDWYYQGVNILDFEWSVGDDRIIYKGDIVIQKSDKSFIQCLPFKTYEYYKKYEGDVVIKNTYKQKLEKEELLIKRIFSLSPNEKKLIGTDQITLSIDGFVAVRFYFPQKTKLFLQSNQIVKVQLGRTSKELGFYVEKGNDLMCEYDTCNKKPFIMILGRLKKNEQKEYKWFCYL
ncbi:MAG: hypothetical protein ACTSXG_04465 [Alphaproteobacteria bacterium]